MLTGLLIATLLSQGTPEAPLTSPRLKVRFSIGSFMGSVWASQAFQRQVFALRDEALVERRDVLTSTHLYSTAPVIGPWLTVIKGGAQAREDLWILVASGTLQAAGLTLLTWALLTDQYGSKSGSKDQLELSLSPYVAGRLGLSVTLTGL